MRPNDVRLIQTRWTLGLIPSEAVPGIALEALEADLDSPALRMLAGEVSPTLSEVAPMFERAFRELGHEPLTRESAGSLIARHWARGILEGEVSAYEGARAIWVEVCDRFGGGERLFVFKALASEHEDYRFAQESAPAGSYDASLRECERRIREEAALLLSGEEV